MPLDEVFVGDPHSAAHNEERDFLNAIEAQIGLINAAVTAADLSADQAEAIRVATALIRDSAVTAASSAAASATSAAASAALAQIISGLEVVDEAVSEVFESYGSASALSAGKNLQLKYEAFQRQTPQVTVSAFGAANPFETILGSVTATNADDVWTTATAHGLVVGDRVRIGAKTGGSFINGLAYYVRSVPSSTTFTLFAQNNSSGGIADIGSDVTAATLVKNPPTTEFMYSRSINTLAVTIASATDLITTPTPHLLRVGDAITLQSNTATGLANDTRYSVVSVPSPTTFAISATFGGAVIDVTADGTATLLRANPNMLFTEGRPVQSSTSAPQSDMVRAWSNTISPGPGTVTQTDLVAHWITDDDVTMIGFLNDGAASTMVYVDDVLVDTVTSAQLTANGTTSGNSASKNYSFPNAQKRRISLRTTGGVLAWAIRRFGRPIVKPVLPNMIKVGIVGDSFTEGTGGALGNGYVQVVARLLGLYDIWKCGSGSTGYKTDGTRLALEDRVLNDVINNFFDIVIIAMGLNDLRSTLTEQNATVASATAVWDAIIAARPTSELIIVGPFPNNGGTSVVADLIELDSALAAAAKTRGLRFISPIGEGWTFGLSDAVHPNTAGHKAIGMRLAGHLSIPYIPQA